MENQLYTIIISIIHIVQIIGGGIAALMLGVSAFHFIKGGREDFAIGKSKLIGIVVGDLLVVGCIPLEAWIQSIVNLG